MADPWGYGAQSQSGYNFSNYIPLQQQQQQQQQGGGMPQINPMQFLNKGGLFGSTMTPTASAQASGTVGAHAAPYAGSASGGASGGGFFSGLFGGGGSGGSSGVTALAANPYAWIAAAIAGNELYQNNTNNRKGEAFPLEWGITGRAAYKDKDVWADKANSVLPGWGDDINIAGSMSSPADLFRGKTWSGMADSLKRGGTLGGILRKVF